MKDYLEEEEESAAQGGGAWLFFAAVLGAWANFHPRAIGWDPAFYSWAVDANLMPHAPYVGYVLAGEFLSLLFPTALGLALFSSVCHVAGVFGLRRAVRAVANAGGEPDPRVAFRATLAALVYAGLPIVQRQAGIQEVYAPAACFALWSLAWLYEGRSWRAGVAFAAGASLWYGLALALPAFLPAFVFRMTGPSGIVRARLRRLVTWAFPIGLWGVVCLGLAQRAFEPYEGHGLAFSDWPRAVGVWQQVHTLGAWWDSLGRALGNFFSEGVVAHPIFLSAGCVAGLLALLRRGVWRNGIWLGYAAPFFALETLVGRNLDLGHYAAYFAPPASVLVALALAWPSEASRLPNRRRVLGVAARLTALAFVVAGTSASRATMPLEELVRYDELPIVVAGPWLRADLPEDAFVVEPSGIGNAGLAAGVHLHRPIFAYRGDWCVLEPYGPRLPLHSAFFRRLDEESLRELVQSSLVVAFDEALGERFEKLEFVPYQSFVPGQPEGLLRLRWKVEDEQEE